MNYSIISKIKNYIGIGFIYFYYFPNNLVTINTILFFLGIMCYSWYLIEEFLSIQKEQKKISIASDLIIDIVVIIFLVNKILIMQQTFNYTNFNSYSTIYLITISVIVFIIHLTKISKLSGS